MPPVSCMNCMDRGVVTYDGLPRACGSCDAGDEYARNGGRKLATFPRSELNPRLLPPGADVVITETKRQAAGLPVGVIGSDTLIRAQIESQPLVHELVGAVNELLRDVPEAAERAVALMERLPEWAIPDDVRNPPEDVAGEQTAPPSQGELVGVAPAKPPRARTARQPRGQHPAAPLEPPAE